MLEANGTSKVIKVLNKLARLNASPRVRVSIEKLGLGRKGQHDLTI
jgi:hypothetical protein